MLTQDILPVGPSVLNDRIIVSAERHRHPNFDDDAGFLELTFSDSTKAVIVSSYEDFTGFSQGEYPTRIAIVGCSFIDYIGYQGMAATILGYTSLTSEQMTLSINYLSSLSIELGSDSHGQNIWEKLVADCELLLASDSPEQAVSIERACQLISLFCRSLSPVQVNHLVCHLRKEEDDRFNRAFPISS
jgi:hypothetical protein